MTDPVTRLNAALEGRYAIESELGGGSSAFHAHARRLLTLLLLSLAGCGETKTPTETADPPRGRIVPL